MNILQKWDKLFPDKNGQKHQTLPNSFIKSWKKGKLFLDGLSRNINKCSPLNLILDQQEAEKLPTKKCKLFCWTPFIKTLHEFSLHENIVFFFMPAHVQVQCHAHIFNPVEFYLLFSHLIIVPQDVAVNVERYQSFFLVQGFPLRWELGGKQ